MARKSRQLTTSGELSHKVTNHSTASSAPSALEFWERVSKITASILIPLMIGFIGYWTNSTLKSQDVGLKYVEIGLSIVQADQSKTTEAMRNWGVDLINQYSKVKIDDPLRAEYVSGGKSMPVSRTTTGGIFQTLTLRKIQNLIHTIFEVFLGITSVESREEFLLIRLSDLQDPLGAEDNSKRIVARGVVKIFLSSGYAIVDPTHLFLQNDQTVQDLCMFIYENNMPIFED